MKSSCTLKGTKIQLKMVDDLQCPGCIHGTDPETCPKYDLEVTEDGNHTWSACKSWRPSTFMGGVGRICLGLPKGFTRSGVVEFHDNPVAYLRLFDPENCPVYNKFNVPVWAMERDGYLYVRCYSPRINLLYVDVIKDGKIEMASFKDGPYEHKAINVGEFYDEID